MKNNNDIPVVQGHPQRAYGYAATDTTDPSGGVAYNNFSNSLNDNDNDDGGRIYTAEELRETRENPPKKYQDVVWALVFVAQLMLVIMMCLYLIGSGQGAQMQGGGSYGNVYFVVGVCGFLAIGLSCASISFMMKNAKVLVQSALIFSVAMSFFMGVLGFFTGNLLMGVLGLVGGVIGCCYAYFVWSRIDFAAVNLKTALKAVKSNLGLFVLAFGMSVLGMAWSTIWFLGVGNALSSNSSPVVFLFFLSYYWTHEVLRNTVHVTSAGVVGTWWFVPAEADAHFSPALRDSFSRATSYSFGSICFGSFLVALIRSLRTLEQYARNNDDMSALVCIIQCILRCIENIIEFFNQWAYVYVGLYGFSYIEAGRNVLNLFQQKGWTVIITDDLADNVLFMMSCGIALVCGLVGWIFGLSDPNLFVGAGWDDAAGPGFLIGFVVGLLLSSILLGVINSAINTVIVCYAEAPAEFQMNHPELSAEMRDAWVQAWPGVVN